MMSGCGGPEHEETVPGQAISTQLEGAARQSDPASKKVLEEAAREAKEHDRLPPAGQPGSFAQDALDQAAAASARSPAGAKDASKTQ
jgi:hypothetical protein